ncbi:MAG TPA: hypothetical protein VGH88_19385 [Streptosporangiaceae bacterium]
MITAYAVPAVAVWTVLGLILGALPVARPAVLLTAGYAACYGLIEVTDRLGGRFRLPPPGTRWQVPQEMVRGVPRGRRLLVWGSILGPGFMTRNPYAGFGLLPIAVATAGSPRLAALLGAATGLAHGTSRALALLRDARPRRAALDPMRLVLTSMRWRTLDGLVLLVISGTASAVVIRLLA